MPPSGYVWWEVGPISFTCEDYQSDPGEQVVGVVTDWQVNGEKMPSLLVPKTRGQFPPGVVGHDEPPGLAANAE